MKNIIKYLKSPKSDFLLLIVLLIFANLVANKSFARFDMTGPKSYSLSKQSIQIVKTLEQPLSIKVFFTSNLPAPYSSVDQYIRDLLVEYKGKANNNFSIEYFDMNNPENESLAYNYNLRQIQIQEVKNNEVGFKSAWMGLVFTYADNIEVLDSITTNEGLEYKITSKMNQIISTTSALSGLTGKVKLTLYKTDELKRFGIAGFDKAEALISNAYTNVNKKNLNRIDYSIENVSGDEVTAVTEKYGLQELNWNNADNTQGKGTLGLVLEYKNNFKVLPIQITRSLFGNSVAGLDDLESSITDNLKSLVATPSEIGYVIGHNELYTDDKQNGSGNFASIISDKYSFYQLDLTSEQIPSRLSSIVIDGPVETYSDIELYKLDQFVLRGGNLIVFIDPFNEEYPESQNSFYAQPSYTPVHTGLEKLLNNWGISMGKDYVMDQNCFEQNSKNIGKMKFYFAPMLQKTAFDKKSVITKNLGYVIMLQNSSIDVSKAYENKNADVTILAKSSPKSWLMDKNINLTPSFITPPTDKSLMAEQNLAVLIEGKFTSAYDEEVKDDNVSDDSVKSASYLTESIQNGKIFVTGSSKITTGQIIDETGDQPVAMFLRNVIDYMNGQEDLCTMRTKGLSINTLTIRSGAAALFAKYFNMFGLVLVVALTGLCTMIKISAKRHNIRARYNPDDSRETIKE